MPVKLTATLPKALAQHERLCVIGAGEKAPEGARRVADTAGRLERAFDGIYDTWREAALRLQAQPSADLAHMPTMSTYASDFGVMLAWLRLVGELAGENEETFVVCDDPWLFRALSTLQDVTAGPPPGIAAKRLRLFCRGLLARIRAAGRALLAMWRTRRHRKAPAAARWLLVYGHPDSDADGFDAYFGDLMQKLPDLRRLMHTDCAAGYALELARDGRTHSLHAWGSIGAALGMLFARWRPDTSGFDPATAWLIDRARTIEGSGGSAAMTHWQNACHTNWLEERNPKTVAWPWENHPWERDFTRAAKRNGTETLGYQHTVVGRHMYNQGAEANRDGTGSIPDRILLNGPSYKDDLVARGIPADRMVVAGAHRIGTKGLPRFDAAGPVFLALSNNPSFAGQMIDACRPLAAADRPFIVKDHPLSPYPVAESANFTYTRAPIAELPAMRALIYCTGTTGLEGLLGGVPTFRFVPEGGIALDILPKGLTPISVSAGALAAALQNTPEDVNHAGCGTTGVAFPPPDMNIWAALLSDEKAELKT